jgi:hypothetical protein
MAAKLFLEKLKHGCTGYNSESSQQLANKQMHQ